MALVRSNILSALVLETSDFFAQAVSKNKAMLAEHYRLLAPDWEKMQVFLEKDRTYRLADESGVLHPTMEVPILYALSAPERLANEYRRFDPVEAGALEFERLRKDDFPMFGLGVAAGRDGGTRPAAYNAANEIAVRAFLCRGVHIRV